MILFAGVSARAEPEDAAMIGPTLFDKLEALAKRPGTPGEGAAALAALAYEHRIEVYRLLVQAGPSGFAASG